MRFWYKKKRIQERQKKYSAWYFIESRCYVHTYNKLVADELFRKRILHIGSVLFFLKQTPIIDDVLFVICLKYRSIECYLVDWHILFTTLISFRWFYIDLYWNNWPRNGKYCFDWLNTVGSLSQPPTIESSIFLYNRS
jgi:hypothetical protein